MTVVFGGVSGNVSAPASDIAAAALLEIGVTAAGDQAPNAEDSAWAIQKLQRQIDQWNAQESLVFGVNFSQFTLIPNHAPHTIGPGGDFNLPTQPVKVNSARFVLNSLGPNPVDSLIEIKDKDWWAANPTKSQISSITTHIYYETGAALGQANFWPICNVANPVRLEIWNTMPQALTPNTVLGFVAGYWDAMVLDLAVRLCPSFEKPVSPDLREQWNRAMRVISANNAIPPRMDTDAGMPNSRRGGRPDFNFLTGMRE